VIRVKILKPWTSPDWLRQTPGGRGAWGECQFSHERDEPADYVVVCNHVPEDVLVPVPKNRAWLVVQEPPVAAYAWIREIYPDYGHIFTSDRKRGVPGLVQHQGGLPWHVDRSYDELSNQLPDFDAKSIPLTWVTSSQLAHRGHRLRMKFLDRLEAAKVPLELRGRGFTPVADKWDALAPARYALAIENHACPFYWTEKVADCFLAGAFPIYWGAQNLEEFFPAESFARVDITDPAAPRRVAEIVGSDLALRNRDALLEARRRVLEEHNFFAWMSRAIADHVRSFGSAPAPSAPHRLRGHSDLASHYLSTSPFQRLCHALRRRLCR
jgi:hypothetical protein